MEIKIDGIELLNSKEIVTKERPDWKAFWIWFVVVFLLSFIAMLVVVPSLDKVPMSIIGITIISSIAGMFGGIGDSTPIEYTTIYNIAVLDETAVDELKEKYEIIKQDGKLYTIKEKQDIKECQNV